MTMNLKKSLIFLIIVVSFIFVCFNNAISCFANEPIQIFAPAKAMVVLEGNSNTVLYHFNKDQKLPMASVTKITTAILAIEKATDLNEKIVVSDNAVGIEGTSIYLDKGEEITIKDLVLGLILASGNDCSVALAEHFGGEKFFVDEMNKKANVKKLALTHFWPEIKKRKYVKEARKIFKNTIACKERKNIIMR